MEVFLAMALSLVSSQPSTAPDACTLLTAREVERIVGVPIADGKSTAGPAGGVLMSQCVFGGSSSRSVSLAVAGVVGGRTGVTPREYWRRQFHPPARRAERENERESEARRIRGVGEEAYWAGNRIGGALYVLRGNTFLRISIGGLRDEADRIAKAKRLARLALARLSKHVS
jgi:hypothetical protein